MRGGHSDGRLWYTENIPNTDLPCFLLKIILGDLYLDARYSRTVHAIAIVILPLLKSHTCMHSCMSS